MDTAQRKPKLRRKRRKPKLPPRFLKVAQRNIDPSSMKLTDTNGELLKSFFHDTTCRCFVLKSFSDANLHKSLKYGVWTTTDAHKILLHQVYNSVLSAVRPVLFFFSVCDTKHFSGIARMTSTVDTKSNFCLWEKQKYEGFFQVEWLLVKDVPNFVLTNIKMSNTPTKKSITSCRDCEEIPFAEAFQFATVFINYSSKTSAFDDFFFHEQKQIELEKKRNLPVVAANVAANKEENQEKEEPFFTQYLRPIERKEA